MTAGPSANQESENDNQSGNRNCGATGLSAELRLAHFRLGFGHQCSDRRLQKPADATATTGTTFAIFFQLFLALPVQLFFIVEQLVEQQSQPISICRHAFQQFLQQPQPGYAGEYQQPAQRLHAVD